MQQDIWQSEEKLVDSLERTLREEGAETSVRRPKIIREFDPGVGRVDILCVWFDQQRLAARISRQEAKTIPLPFTRLSAYIMAHITAEIWTDISSLSNMFRIPLARLHRAIDVLTSRGLVEQDAHVLRATSHDEIYHIDSIEAYEAKLKRWRDAVHQADLHRWFASSRYVVMPELSTRVQNDLLQTCTLSDIGIMLYHDENHSTIPFAPQPRAVPKTHIGWYLNELVFDEERLHASGSS